MPLQFSESLLPVLPLICVTDKSVWDFQDNFLLLNSKCCQVLEGHMIWINVPPRICVFEWFHSVTRTWIIDLFTAFTVALNWHVVWIPLSFLSLALVLCVICVCFCECTWGVYKIEDDGWGVPHVFSEWNDLMRFLRSLWILLFWTENRAVPQGSPL